LIKQGELGRLATTVRAFDNEEFTREPVITVFDHRRMSLGFSCYSDMNTIWE
jgi:hypothetical protein